MNKTGSCLCGDIHFEVEGDFESFFLCHCSHCRKDTGSAHAASLFSTSAKLTWISGKQQAKVFKLPTTRHVKSFCSNCGSALPFEDKDDGYLAVPAGSLDCKVPIEPTAHIFMASKADWEQNLDKVLKFDAFPQMDNTENN